MPFDVIWSERALRQLRKLDRPVAKRIFERVGELREGPLLGVQRMVNSPYYRLRVGGYRVFLDIERDGTGRVYRILWGPPPVNTTRSGGVAEKHSGAHRGEELQRFLVPLYGMSTEIRVSGGGAKEPQAYRVGPLSP